MARILGPINEFEYLGSLGTGPESGGGEVGGGGIFIPHSHIASLSIYGDTVPPIFIRAFNKVTGEPFTGSGSDITGYFYNRGSVSALTNSPSKITSSHLDLGAPGSYRQIFTSSEIPLVGDTAYYFWYVPSNPDIYIPPLLVYREAKSTPDMVWSYASRSLTDKSGFGLADNAITSSKIANNAITAAKIADNTITADKVADNTITSSKIANNAITVDKVADGTITANKIANNAITSTKIADGILTSAKIADSAITADKIASNAITSTKIADGSLTSAKIADNAITSSKIASNAITSTKIADGSLTSAKIADNAITSTKIADGTITADKIASSAITSSKIADGLLTDAKIADGAITADKIANSAITSTKIADGALTSAKIADDAITADKVADSALNGKGDWNTVAPDNSKIEDLHDWLSARYVYLDNLNIGGLVASSAQVSSITQSSRVKILTDEFYFRPSSGTSYYTVMVNTYNSSGESMDAVSTPTYVCFLNGSVVQSGSTTRNGLGDYRFEVAIPSSYNLGTFIITVTVELTQNSPSIYTKDVPLIETQSSSFSTADRQKLESIYDKLPSYGKIAGSVEVSFVSGQVSDLVLSYSSQRAAYLDLLPNMANNVSNIVAKLPTNSAISSASATDAILTQLATHMTNYTSQRAAYLDLLSDISSDVSSISSKMPTAQGSVVASASDVEAVYDKAVDIDNKLTTQRMSNIDDIAYIKQRMPQNGIVSTSSEVSGVQSGVNSLVSRLTEERASKIDHLDADISSRLSTDDNRLTNIQQQLSDLSEDLSEATFGITSTDLVNIANHVWQHQGKVVDLTQSSIDNTASKVWSISGRSLSDLNKDYFDSQFSGVNQLVNTVGGIASSVDGRVVSTAGNLSNQINSAVNTLKDYGDANWTKSTAEIPANFANQVSDVILNHPSMSRLVEGFGPIRYEYTLKTQDNTPIPNALIYVYNHPNLTISALVARGVTNNHGKVVFYLTTGTYYFVRMKAGMSFDNPDVELVANV